MFCNTINLMTKLFTTVINIVTRRLTMNHQQQEFWKLHRLILMPYLQSRQFTGNIALA